ncbi:NAD-dependent epimerase/dehydratase family protein [Massilia cavernae]|uniref:NAD-dependent epimerase/dehydratase family protein n=1 Tax=Massilia cavernae TaxID=2320864 RepID=A0A418XRA3_9BURK|nr:NAD-dependent epimerase/dehydratase family protein [Massilia cavernae]
MSRHLPMTHIPQLVLCLPALPISPNGKVDRKRVAEQLSALWAPAEAEAPGTQACMLDRIVTCYRSVLLDNDVGPDGNFFDHGGDSLAAVNLSLMLARTIDRTVAVTALYRYPTPRALDGFLSGCGTVGGDECALPEVEFSNRGAPAAVSRKLLLTGATGFIGIHLLGRLVATTTLAITVLLRGASAEAALARLAAAYRRAHPGQTLPHERIEVLLGDLVQPGWGLSEQAWRYHTQAIDEVVHCGAEVNFLFHASQLFAVNVGGTLALIRFCDEGKVKQLHHISSMAAKLAPTTGKALSFADASALGATGYGYTKYLSDHLVASAQAQGLAARIYHVDDVLPSIGTGLANSQSLAHILLMHCLQHGLAPQGCGDLGLLSADALAQWLCGFIGTRERFAAAPPVLDVIGQQLVPFDQLVRSVATKLERSAVPIAYDAFLAFLKQLDHSGAALLHDILPPAGGARVAFTKLGLAGEEQPVNAGIPQAQLLAANTDDFNLYIRALGRELDGGALKQRGGNV